MNKMLWLIPETSFSTIEGKYEGVRNLRNKIDIKQLFQPKTGQYFIIRKVRLILGLICFVVLGI